MRDNFSVEEILEAVNRLLNTKTEKIQPKKNKNHLLPADTEKIISQAESYIKKK